LKSQFLNMKATEYEDKNGEKKYWVWTQRVGCRKAVVIVAVVDNGMVESSPNLFERDLRLVVTKEFRVPMADYEYGFPAGLIDKDENIIEAATRELFEETGLEVKKVLRSSPFLYNSAGITDESVAMVYVECDGEISKDKLEASEDIETFLMTRADVAELLKDDMKKLAAKFWILAENFVRYNEI